MSVVAIIPLYNGSRFINLAIESVLGQTCPADEIVVVDDGSTDGGAGAAIVGTFARSDPRICLITQANGGQGRARNVGVQNSTSALIAFLDQDDVWYPQHLERLQQSFKDQPDLGWVYSNLDGIDATGRLVGRKVLDSLSRDGEHPKTTLAGCLGSDMYVLPGASLISRQAFEAVGGFDSQFVGYEDDDLFLRLFLAGYKNVYLNEALTQWRSHATNTSRTEKMAASRRRYYEKICADHPDHVLHTIDTRFIRTAFQDYCINALHMGAESQRRATQELEFFAAKLSPRRRLMYLGVARLLVAIRAQYIWRILKPFLPYQTRRYALGWMRRL